MLSSPAANNEAYSFWRHKVRQRIVDPGMAEKLVPTVPPHPLGTKRPSLESAYFEVYNQSNVHLVDLKDEPIVEITQGIITKTQEFDLDILIFATGFDFITGSMLAMGIRGIGGRKLNEQWDVSSNGKGVFTHLGMTTSGFPNMFFPMGPQAPTALGLTPHMAEVQGGSIAECIDALRQSDRRRINATHAAERDWKEEVMCAAEKTLFPKTSSWYMGVNIEGRTALLFWRRRSVH